jgi:hypothetical protein
VLSEVQIIDFARAIRAGVAMMADTLHTPRAFDSHFTPVQLAHLYQIKTQLLSCDPESKKLLDQTATRVQRMVRRCRIIKLVHGILETRSHYHPAVIALDHHLQSHGLDRHVQELIDDDHDVWTISQCTPGDLKSVYAIPMGAAVRLLQDLQRKFTTVPDGLADPLPHKTSNRAVAMHVAKAVLVLLEVLFPDEWRSCVVTGLALCKN